LDGANSLCTVRQQQSMTYSFDISLSKSWTVQLSREQLPTIVATAMSAVNRHPAITGPHARCRRCSAATALRCQAVAAVKLLLVTCAPAAARQDFSKAQLAALIATTWWVKQQQQQRQQKRLLSNTRSSAVLVICT
jgi:hypothetical protein